MLYSFIFSPLEQFSCTRAKLDEVNNDNSQRDVFKAMATGVERCSSLLYCSLNSATTTDYTNSPFIQSVYDLKALR